MYSMGSRIIVLFLIVCSFRWGEGEKRSGGKVVSTLLNAKWRETDFISEGMEFLDSVPFWEYMEESSSMERESMSDKDLYDHFMLFALGYMPWTQINMLKFALSLRIASPKIETFQQIALDRGVESLGCSAVIETSSGLSCSLKDKSSEQKGSDELELLKIDHIYPHNSVDATETIILYGLVGTSETHTLHEELKSLASQGKIRYIFRPYLHNRPSNKVRLSGYGVELQIKSTEYKAQDDRKVEEDEEDGYEDSSSLSEGSEKEVINGIDFKKLESNFPDMKDKLDEFKQHVKDQNNDMAPMKVWQLQDLSMQASERIINSPQKDQLSVLTDIAQNFPSHARSLSRVKVSKDLKKEITRNSEEFSGSMNIQPSDAALFINGIQFDMDYADIFTIFDSLKTEGSMLDGLGKLDLTESQANKLISLDFKSESEQSYGLDIRDSAIKWVNDIEKDKMYVGWPRSIDELLRPTFPGMLRNIRKNLFNVVIMFDPTDIVSSYPILRLLESFYVHSTPLRIGLLFNINSDLSVTGLKDPGVALFQSYNYIAESKGNYEALSFLTDFYGKLSPSDKETLSVETVIKEFKVATGEYDSDDVFGEDSGYDVGRVSSKEFIIKSGFKSFPQVLMNGVSLDAKNLNAEDFEETMMRFIMRETNKLQKAVYHRELTDNKDVTDYLMEQSHIMPRLSDRVLKESDDGNKGILDMSTGAHILTNLNANTFGPLDASSKVITMANHLNYATFKDDYKLVPLTVWIIADLETIKGRELLRNAVMHSKQSKQTRISFITNNGKGVGMMTRSAQLAFESLTNSPLKTLLSKILKEETVKALISGKKNFRNFDIPGAEMSTFADIIENRPKEAIFEIHSMFAADVLGFKPGENGVVVNGRVIGPFDSDESFSSDDFSLLEKFSMSQFGDKLVHSLYEVINIADSSGKTLSDKAMRISSLLISRPPGKTRSKISFAGDKKSVIKIEPMDPDLPSFDVVAISDPVSRGAQKLSSILLVLSKIINCRIRFFLNAVDKHSEMPQKSYFRTVLESEISFDSITGKRSSGPAARFSQLPETPIFTMHYHIPDNWLVEPVKSIYDMDNIKLENIDSNVVHSEYELEHLLVEGHCFEALTGNSPRGLQLTLGTKKEPLMVDTIVMANLGYLQLKGNPGRWLMQLRDGRSKNLYEVISQDGGESLENNTVQVLVTSFQSTIVKLKVSKKSDMQHEELLGSSDHDKADGGIWNSITSTFTGSSNKEELDSSEENDNVLNIFCLASGHLYERLLKIMMLSTIRNTKANVKFWILKGYLSPSLKEFLPEYARRYGFDYEYVQYKWPRWLNQQKEKQRIIWGYKILFLDVMFPLDVKKIIFVDTDQIVRADLTELRDMDLGGAPYGYTPFCDSNKDMEGFRFWKSGYWKNHLAGRAYHISALYVVDLVKFRQIAAGDRLRGQYQALSQDPNSLANLDQDLPNNMVHQVPIKSLPQEWLYCETWCAKETLKNAKSIDLCNNPLTKESKLDAARRIVKEWPQLDAEMQKLTDEIMLNKKKQQKSPHDHSEL
uniref:UDP-glucose:glycoprotein glucosyltransferase n=1 Tax=Lepeophtheirus salmonis TaxID=72036 RepID=A0A0K2UY63_LEPSM